MARQMRAVIAATILAGLLAACSPEAMRSRSGGPGADIGNRSPSVEMHGPLNPYYKTKAANPATGR